MNIIKIIASSFLICLVVHVSYSTRGVDHSKQQNNKKCTIIREPSSWHFNDRWNGSCRVADFGTQTTEKSLTNQSTNQSIASTTKFILGLGAAAFGGWLLWTTRFNGGGEHHTMNLAQISATPAVLAQQTQASIAHNAIKSQRSMPTFTPPYFSSASLARNQIIQASLQQKKSEKKSPPLGTLQPSGNTNNKKKKK